MIYSSPKPIVKKMWPGSWKCSSRENTKIRLSLPRLAGLIDRTITAMVGLDDANIAKTPAEYGGLGKDLLGMGLPGRMELSNRPRDDAVCMQQPR
jgi:hypothetical protein